MRFYFNGKFVAIDNELSSAASILDAFSKTIPKLIEEFAISNTSETEECGYGNEDFERTIRKHFGGLSVILICSTYESCLSKFRKILQEKFSCEGEWIAKKRNETPFTYQARIFSSEKTTATEVFSPKQLEDIQLLYSIRNCFAHQNGNIEKISENHLKFINEKETGYFEAEYNELIVYGKYIDESFLLVQTLIKGSMILVQ